MKELKSILRKAVEDNIISEKGGLKGIYDACKKLGYKGPKEEFEKKFFELVKSEIESSCMVNEEDLDSIAGGKGDIAKKIAAFGLALAGPAMGMSSQVGATFEGIKNLDVKTKFKLAGDKASDFVNKNPVKAAKIAAGASVAATGALSAALVAAGFGVKALAARISACPLFAINKWDDQGNDTKTFIGSFKGLDGIIGKQERDEDGKVTSSTISESNLENKIGEIKGFFGKHELDKPVETPKPSENTTEDKDKTEKPEKKEESNPFNRIFQSVSGSNINKLRELVAEEEAPEPAAADTQNQEELSDEAKAAAEAKEKAKKEAKIEKIYKYWEGAKADLKTAIQKAVKDPSIASKFVNLALELQKVGLLGGEDLNDDKVHENFTRAKDGMNYAEREMARVRQEASEKLEQAEAKRAEASEEFQKAAESKNVVEDALSSLGDINKNTFEQAVIVDMVVLGNLVKETLNERTLKFIDCQINTIKGKMDIESPSEDFINRWTTDTGHGQIFNSRIFLAFKDLIGKVPLSDNNAASTNYLNPDNSEDDKNCFVENVRKLYSFIENEAAREQQRDVSSDQARKKDDWTKFKAKLDKIVKVTTKAKKGTTTTINQQNLNLVDSEPHMKLIVKLFKLQDLINNKMQEFVRQQSVAQQ